MSKNKHAHGGGTKHVSPAPKTPATPEPKRSKLPLIAAVAVVLVVIAVAVVSGQGKKAGGPGGIVQPSAEEAAYIGRLLPAGYTAPSVSGPETYGSVIEMTELSLTPAETQVSVPVADVAAAKLALLQYEGAQSLPLVAYVKPSGALFVGVSYCPPCQGEWQTIQPDGTLTCNSCGTKRDLESQAGVSGTCKLYPLDELPVTIVDGNIVIERAVIDTWTAQPLDRQVG